jgi:hypothetical protein
VDICVLKAPPRVRSRVCAQAECSEARLVAPGADPARLVPDRGPASSPTLGSSCQLISTVTETKQGVTPRGKDAWARQILYTLQRSGLPAGASRCLLRCGRRVICRIGLGGPRCTNDADEREPNERISRADDRLRRAFRVSCACAPGASGKISSLSRSRERCSDELKQGIKHKKRQLKDGKWLACPA